MPRSQLSALYQLFLPAPQRATSATIQPSSATCTAATTNQPSSSALALGTTSQPVITTALVDVPSIAEPTTSAVAATHALRK